MAENPASAGAHPGRLARPVAILLLAVFALGWFGPAGERRLIRPDEGRYAEIAREMVATGDWLTPRLNGYKYFEKPALQYWMTAAAFSAFGISDAAARIWPALTGFLGVLLVFFAGNRILGPPSGLIAAAALAGNFIYALVGHALTLDMGVSFFLSASVLAFALAQRDDASPAETRNWMLGAWALTALAVLSKGLIGIVLPAGAVFLYVLAERDWRLIGRMQLLAGGALFLAITAPWFVWVSRANPEFFDFFFIHEHFERFLTRAHGRYQPAWYFVPILLAGMVPWTIALFPALVHAWRRTGAQRFHAGRFLLAWCAVVFAFFSASGSKLPSYILPMVPALALLIGHYLARAGGRVAMAQALAMALLGMAVMFWAPHLVDFADASLPAELMRAAVPWLAGAGLALAALAAVSAAAWWKQFVIGGALALGAGGAVFAQLVLAAHGELSPVYSAYHSVQRIRPLVDAAGPGVPFYMVNTFDHTLPYYLGRTVTMVGDKDELAISIGWEPAKFIPDLASFARAWRSDREAFAMLPAREFEEIRNMPGLSMQVIATDPRRVFVKKP